MRLIHTLTTLALAAAVLLAAPPAEADGPIAQPGTTILEQALERAVEMRPRLGVPGAVQRECPANVVEDAYDEAENARTGAQTAFGLLMPVIMPVIIGGSTPAPPMHMTATMDGTTASCYRTAYGERLRERRTDAAWQGTWYGLAAWGGLTILSISTGP